MTLTTCTRCGHESADHEREVVVLGDGGVGDFVVEHCTRCDCVRELA